MCTDVVPVLALNTIRKHFDFHPNCRGDSDFRVGLEMIHTDRMGGLR